MNAFKQLLQATGSHPPVGTWIGSASPVVAEAIGHAGFDWGVIDMEHTPLDLMDLLHLLQALASSKLLPVVRVAGDDPATIRRVLDTGATTLLLPFVENAEQARAAVAATRHPPRGVRSAASFSRASRFGTLPAGARNVDVAVIAQLHTPQAVEGLEAIAAVDGIDAIFLSAADLAAYMGHAGQPTHPAVMELMWQAARRCRAIGKPVGTQGFSPEVVAQYRAAGFDYLAIGSDIELMMRGAHAVIKALRTPDAEHVHTLAAGTHTSTGY
jgi:2-keto-3-deoxy-L-rhamnonate aldolase RhmA